MPTGQEAAAPPSGDGLPDVLVTGSERVELSEPLRSTRPVRSAAGIKQVVGRGDDRCRAAARGPEEAQEETGRRPPAPSRRIRCAPGRGGRVAGRVRDKA